jgi:hypothetical protein
MSPQRYRPRLRSRQASKLTTRCRPASVRHTAPTLVPPSDVCLTLLFSRKTSAESNLTFMALARIERNQIYEAIAASTLDPAECDLREERDVVTILHRGSGSTLKFYKPRGSRSARYRIAYQVADGHSYTLSTEQQVEKAVPFITLWANEVKEITDAPDLWVELQRNRELIADIQQPGSDNTPFTEDEQRQISAQLQEIKNQIREQFDLATEQIEHIDARLDEAEKASKRIGRKDWLLLFGGTILNLNRHRHDNTRGCRTHLHNSCSRYCSSVRWRTSADTNVTSKGEEKWTHE